MVVPLWVVKYCPFPLLLPLVNTKACTTVHAVMDDITKSLKTILIRFVVSPIAILHMVPQ